MYADDLQQLEAGMLVYDAPYRWCRDARGEPMTGRRTRRARCGHERNHEAIHGQPRVGFNEADDLVNFRTTLLAEYKDGPVRVAAELWDSRVYGGDQRTPITTGEVNPVELVQAFVEVKSNGLFGGDSTASFQAGRFLMNLGSRRLVAADDYRNTTNGYTGVRADLGWPDGWKATFVYTLPQRRRPDDPAELRRNVVALDREGFDLVLWCGMVNRARAIGTTTNTLNEWRKGAAAGRL
jgi:hypothetical protein